MDDGPRQRRPLHRRELDARRRRRLPLDHRASRPGIRIAGGDILHRHGVVGAEADRAGVCVRAGLEAAAGADVSKRDNALG